MAILNFEGRELSSLAGESVLDCLLRNNIAVTNSCRSGICQSCLLKTTMPVSEASQKGLSDSKKKSGFFLSCQQKIENDLVIFKSNTQMLEAEGVITAQERLSDSVVRLKIQPVGEYDYRAGQFLNLIRDDGLCRSYSIASQSKSKVLEFHIRKVPGGMMSNWLYSENLLGKRIHLSEARGDCCLTDAIKEKDLMLIGVGTGLAPLYGVLKDRLAAQAQQKIILIHGGLTIESLYLVENLKGLECEHSQFSYQPLFLQGEKREGYEKGDLVEYIKAYCYDYKNTVVMICGDPLLVKKIKQAVFMSGVPSNSILSDSFISHHNEAT